MSPSEAPNSIDSTSGTPGMSDCDRVEAMAFKQSS